MFKKFRKSRIFSLIKILFFIAVCFVIGASAAYVNHESDPTDQAMAYFKAFLEEDYQAMFKMVEVQQGQYVDQDLYAENIKKVRGNIVVDSYEIADPVEENGKYVVNIACLNSNNDTSQNFVVRLNKKRKGLQIIPDYTVSIDHMMVENLVVEVPSGFELLLNDKAVTDIATVEQKKKKDVYTIPSLLGGTYSVSAQQGYKALTENVDVVRADTNITISGDTYTASSQYRATIEENSKKFIDEFYAAAKERNPERKALVKMLSADELKAQVSQLVTETQEIFYWRDIRTIADYTVSELNFSSLVANIVYDEANSAYKVTYDYTYDYKAETETSLYNSYVYMLTGTCTTSLEMTYAITEDDVTLQSVVITNENIRKEDNSLRKPEED